MHMINDQVAAELTDKIQNPLSLTPAQALSGKFPVGSVLFVDKGSVSAALGDKYFSESYLCIGRDDDSQPILLAINEEEDVVRAINLDEALSGVKSAKVIPLHSGHEDPTVQKIIMRQAERSKAELPGKRVSHYQLSEDKYIQAFAYVASTVATASLMKLMDANDVAPSATELFQQVTTAPDLSNAATLVGAAAMLYVGKKLLSGTTANLLRKASSIIAERRDWAENAQSFALRAGSKFESFLKQTHEKGIPLVSGITKSLWEHMYTDKYMVDPDRYTTCKAINEFLAGVNPAAGKALKTHMDDESQRIMPPSRLYAALTKLEGFGKPVEIITNGSLSGNIATAVNATSTAVGKKAGRLVNAIKSAGKKQLTGTGGAVTVHKVEDDQGTMLQLIDSQTGVPQVVLGHREVNNMFEPVELSNDSSLTRKLRDRYLIGEDETVEVVTSNHCSNRIAP